MGRVGDRYLYIDEGRLKELFRESIAEFIEERKDMLCELVAEAIEDIAMTRAIKDGESTEIDTDYKKDLLREVEGLSSEKVKEVLDYIYFIKAKDVIDPSQMYFWTTKWQEMEKKADRDKEAGNIVGDGNVEDLLKNLKK